MLDRVTTLSATAASPVTTALARRRALFAGLVGATIAAVLWLALVAVPPYSAGAISFLVLFTVTLPWSVVGFWNAAIGFLIMRFCRDPAAAVNPLAVSVRGDEPVTASTAILMCIRNESPEQVTRNLQPLMDGLVRANVAHLFHVYLLSDSSDPGVIAAETTRFDAFIAKWQGTIPVTYRRRQVNTAFKSGNIRDFCDRWGNNYDFAITLDADSFMPAETVLRLVRIAQANPSLGILQTLVVGLPSVSVFARVFQFGMRLGMRSYTLGATWWQGDCGPYWGHNAIIRLAPFIAHCRMPVLPGNGPLSGHVLSHDQVEAALMRRAGYEVRVLPVDGVSWEENPPTLMEFSRRDLRWCQGNMQYWQLLTLPGLKPVSRFQLVFAIWMYLGSPAWMAMTAIGTVLLALSEAQTGKYVPLKASAGTALFAIMMLMTFAPKIASMIDVLLTNSARRSFGGTIPFALNIATEAAFMVLLTPIIALTHTIFLYSSFCISARRQLDQPDAREPCGALAPRADKAVAADDSRLHRAGRRRHEGSERYRLRLDGHERAHFGGAVRRCNGLPSHGSFVREDRHRPHPRGKRAAGGTDAAMPAGAGGCVRRWHERRPTKTMFDSFRTVRGIVRSLRIYYGDRQHGPAMDRLYRQFVQPGDLVFDIGAHVGDRIAAFRRLGARVVAVEPQPALLRTLRLLYGGDPMVTIEAAAVGRQPGIVELNVNLDNPTVSTVSTDFIAAAANAPGWQGQAWSKRVRVPLTSLDSLIVTHGTPAFIKIDVEGFEAEALAGLTQPPQALSFEFTLIQRELALACVERCGTLGYASFNAVLGESQSFEHSDWIDAPAISRWLSALPPEANSGDVYARLA